MTQFFYFPPSFDGSLTIGESIEFWSEFNNLTSENMITLNSNVEKYIYSNESSTVKFIHYKVYNGGHEWFNSNWGFHSSEELINFFLEYKLSDFTQIIGDLNQDGIINIQDLIQVINIILNNDFDISADLNQDNEVNILDVLQVISYILGNSDFTDEQEFLSDLNNDGMINVLDVIVIVNMILQYRN